MIRVLTGEKSKKTEEKGITLIALVVTIIVLLILAGISIMMLTGQNGILIRTQEASKKTGRASIIEQAQLDIVDRQTQNKGNVSEQDLHDILTRYFTNVPDKLPEDLSTLILNDGKYNDIKASEIYNGTLNESKIEVKAEDMLGKNLKNYQGDFVDLKLDITGTTDTTDDWRIFYVGNESGESRIFLIAADYVSTSKLRSLGIIDNSEIFTYGNNGIYWKDNFIWNQNEYNDNFLDLVLCKDNKGWGYTAYGHDAVARYLLDRDVWKKIAKNSNIENVSKVSNRSYSPPPEWNPIGNGIDFIIGAPTITMWSKAWNAVASDDENLYEIIVTLKNDEEEEYMEIKSSGPMNSEQDAPLVKDENMHENDYLKLTKSTFFTGNFTEDVPDAMWIADSWNKLHCPCSIYYGGVTFSNYNWDRSACGIRPVLCLESDVILKKDIDKSTNEKTIYNLYN